MKAGGIAYHLPVRTGKCGKRLSRFFYAYSYPLSFQLIAVFSLPKFIVMEVQYAIFGLGTPEIVVIVLVVLLLFGGKKIPELMRGLGQGVREFNSAKTNLKQEIEEGMRNKPDATKEGAKGAVEEKKS